MSQEDNQFKHFVYLASEVLVLRLDGILGREAKDQIEEVNQEILSLEFTHLILNLSKVTQIDRPTYRFLVQIQSFVRKEREGKVRVVLPPTLLKERLTNEGILKNSEICKNLKEALESL